MALKIGSLFVSLSSNSDGFSKSLGQALKSVESFAKNVKRVASEVASATAPIAALGAGMVAMAAGVDGPTKRAVDGLHKSIQLVAVQIANMLLPAVKALADMFRSAAATIAGLSPALKEHISDFAVMAVKIAAASKALSVLSGGVSGVASILRALVAVMGGVSVVGLLELAFVLGTIIAVVALLHRAWRENWAGIQGATESVLEWLRGAFSQLAKFFKGVWDFLVDGAAAFVESLLRAGEAVEKLTGKNLGIAGMREGFAGLWKDLKSGEFFSGAFTFGKSVGAQLVDGIAEEWKLISKELGLDKLAAQVQGMFSGGGATIGLGRGMGEPKPVVSGAMQGRIDARGAVNAGADWVRAMNDLVKQQDAAAVALELSRQDELKARAAITAGIENQAKMARARATGSTSGLNKAQLRDFKAENSQVFNSAVSAGSWSDAQKTLAEGLKGADNVGTQLHAWGARMGPMLQQSGTQLLGAVGDLVNSVVQGAQQGGVWGAIIAAFMEIAKKTESAMKFLDVAMEFIKQLAQMIEPLVKPIFGALTKILGVVVQIIAPVFAALEPLFTAFGKALENLAPVLYAIGDLFQAFAPILSFIGNVIGAILDALKPFNDLLAGIIKVIATVLLGIIIAFNELAAAFGDEKAAAESKRLQGVISSMWARTPEQDAANMDAAGSALELAAANSKAAESARALAESLTNVPSGYRVALVRYQSDAAGQQTGNPYGSGNGGGG